MFLVGCARGCIHASHLFPVRSVHLSGELGSFGLVGRSVLVGVLNVKKPPYYFSTAVCFWSASLFAWHAWMGGWAGMDGVEDGELV